MSLEPTSLGKGIQQTQQHSMHPSLHYHCQIFQPVELHSMHKLLARANMKNQIVTHDYYQSISKGTDKSFYSFTKGIAMTLELYKR